MQLQDEETWDDVGGLINVTPLVDVVFQLLLFFMLTTTFQHKELEQLGVELPQASAGTSEQAPGLVIEVHRDGRLSLSGRTVTDAELRFRLQERAKADKQTAVTIRGDAQAMHQAIVGVMDACASAGLTQLAVGTLESKAAGKAPGG